MLLHTRALIAGFSLMLIGTNKRDRKRNSACKADAPNSDSRTETSLKRLRGVYFEDEAASLSVARDVIDYLDRRLEHYLF